MNVFRGDINRLTRQSYASDSSTPSDQSVDENTKHLVIRCNPLR